MQPNKNLSDFSTIISREAKKLYVIINKVKNAKTKTKNGDDDDQ